MPFQVIKQPREYGVYHLECNGKRYYRLGNGPANARENLRRELGVKRNDIEILDNGKMV